MRLLSFSLIVLRQFSFYLWHLGLVFTRISHSTSVHCVYLVTLYSALLYGFCSSAFVLWLDYSALVFDHRYSAFIFGVGVDCRLLYVQRHICYSYSGRKQGLMFKVFNATFNNISVLSLLSDLLVKETRVSRENHYVSFVSFKIPRDIKCKMSMRTHKIMMDEIRSE